MSIRLRALPLFLVLLVATACGGSTEPEDVIDFSGTWRMDIYFSYPPEDVSCEILGVTLTVAQNDEVLSGGTTGGTESCRQGETTWPSDQIGALSLTGNARASSVIFTLAEAGQASLTFTGQPKEGRFDGSFQGSAFLDPFNLGDVTVGGTWTAQR